MKVGSDVTKFKEGDEVYADVSEAPLNNPRQVGSLAQFTAVEEKLLVIKPANLSFAEAASLPLAVLTAQEALDRAGLTEGQTIFINGGAGGVGSLAIQVRALPTQLVTFALLVFTLNFPPVISSEFLVDHLRNICNDTRPNFS